MACLVWTDGEAAQKARKKPSRPAAAASHDGDSVSDLSQLKSSSVMVMRQNDGGLLYAKNTNAVVPIASITKLMTAQSHASRLILPLAIASHFSDLMSDTEHKYLLS